MEEKAKVAAAATAEASADALTALNGDAAAQDWEEKAKLKDMEEAAWVDSESD